MIDKEEMVNNQLLKRGIKDPRVLSAMRNVPREKFVPEDLCDCAYLDGPLPIGEEQTISQPYIVALMTELLELKGAEKVLEVGTGSGYQTAVLAEIAEKVYSLEVIESLAAKAGETLKKLGYENFEIKVSSGYKGWEAAAPFDAIIITCAPEEVPRVLLKQLKEGGRMVVPVGGRIFGQKLLLLKKEKDEIIEQDCGGVMFVPMVDDA
ncbi:MAG: protein-L-isoaspartate(D-aspartate) O-methyltransferase [Armatimonadota bacterium]